MMKILVMVLLVMPRYVGFLAINQPILLYDNLYDDDEDIDDGGASQQIPTSHIPTRWEYVMMMKGGI